MTSSVRFRRGRQDLSEIDARSLYPSPAVSAKPYVPEDAIVSRVQLYRGDRARSGEKRSPVFARGSAEGQGAVHVLMCAPSRAASTALARH